MNKIMLNEHSYRSTLCLSYVSSWDYFSEDLSPASFGCTAPGSRDQFSLCEFWSVGMKCCFLQTLLYRSFPSLKKKKRLPQSCVQLKGGSQHASMELTHDCSSDAECLQGISYPASKGQGIVQYPSHHQCLEPEPPNRPLEGQPPCCKLSLTVSPAMLWSAVTLTC